MVAKDFHLETYVDFTGCPAFFTEVDAYPAVTVIRRGNGETTRAAFRPEINTGTLNSLILVSPKSTTSGQFTDLSPTTGFRYFLSRLAGHLAGERELSEPFSGRVREDGRGTDGKSLMDGEWFESIEEKE